MNMWPRAQRGPGEFLCFVLYLIKLKIVVFQKIRIVFKKLENYSKHNLNRFLPEAPGNIICKLKQDLLIVYREKKSVAFTESIS